MDLELFNEAQETMPWFNQDILDGLAYRGLSHAKEEVDLYIACAERSYPPGFEFKGSVECGPIETYCTMASLMTRSERATASIDLAPSGVTLYKYQFACNGVDLIPRYLYLPYFRRGGLILITGKLFGASPVLADPGLSIGSDYVFIRMSRAPVTFRRVIWTVLVNGEEKSSYMAFAWLHNRGGANNKTGQSDTITIGKVASTLPHYLFCRYGMLETFRKFANTEVELASVFVEHDVKPEERQAIIRAELTSRGYDLNKYEVITSCQVRPGALKSRAEVYSSIESSVVLLMPKDKVSALTMSFATAFFYMVDVYPEVDDLEELAGSERWKIWLGYILFGDQLGWGKLVENVESHLTSLDDYVDVDVRRTLIEEEGLDVETIYELFAYILVEIDGLIAGKEEDIGSMYGKRLLVSQYVLRDITEQIFRCLFEITNNKKRKHTAEDYNKILGKYFMPTIIFNLRKTSMKSFMSSVSTPGDNMYFKITSRLVMQAQTSAGRKPQNINVNDPLSRLNSSFAQAGNYLILPKNHPLGNQTLNATVKLDGKNTIQKKEHMMALDDHINEAIHRN